MTTGFPFPVKMPAAMRLTALTLMFVVAAGQDFTTSSAAKLTTLTPTSSTQVTSSHPISVSLTTETNRPTPTVTSATTSEHTSSSPPSSTSLQTSQAGASTLTAQPSTAGANQTSNETTSHGLTFPSTAVTVNATSNSTVAAPLHDKNQELWNPGLVAVLCIFCIVVGLVLVVATIKCFRSRRSNFERLEDDLPMSKVNEQSPFAHYSK